MQKQEKIVDMFNQIAPTYDVANRVLSLGVDVSWRKFACRYMLEIFKNKSINIVDVACGTGDMMGLWSEISKEFGVEVEKPNWHRPIKWHAKRGEGEISKF